MYDEVLNPVLRGKVKKENAILSGYRRVKIHGESYPGLIEDSSHHVEGILLSNLSHSNLKQLDIFEGDYYERQKVSVTTRENEKVTCEVYLFKTRYKHLLSRTSWCSKTFYKKHLKQFLNSYVR
jgi:gamma-glutamylcyclotransferase (GGCT)/AIG2-like uncharacterized protein YtfP